MTLLAIDTATQYMSIALHDGGAMIAEHSWHSGNHHSVELAPAVQGMLDHASVTPNDLTALAVSTGPGSYTGLRIGVALAKGMALANDLPLVGISSLDILAAAQPPMQGALLLVLGAGRSRIVAARYHWRKGRWKQRGEPENMDWATLMSSIDGAACISGEISAEGLDAIEAVQREGVPVTLAPPTLRMRRAGFLAEEAWARLREDGANAFPAAAVVPVYVQTKDSPR